MSLSTSTLRPGSPHHIRGDPRVFRTEEIGPIPTACAPPLDRQRRCIAEKLGYCYPFIPQTTACLLAPTPPLPFDCLLRKARNYELFMSFSRLPPLSSSLHQATTRERHDAYTKIVTFYQTLDHPSDFDGFKTDILLPLLKRTLSPIRREQPPQSANTSLWLALVANGAFILHPPRSAPGAHAVQRSLGT